MAGTEPVRATQPSGLRRRPWILAVVAGAVIVAVVLVGSLTLPRLAPRKTVTAAPSAVVLAASDIPDVGWGLRASGANGTGVWRLFSVHNELILAFLNVTLWVDATPGDAARAMGAVVSNLTYPVQPGNVTAADASLFWSYGSGFYGGMVVRRYNVVFVLNAYLESSWSLTKSDFGLWAGWQLAKIESHAS